MTSAAERAWDEEWRARGERDAEFRRFFDSSARMGHVLCHAVVQVPPELDVPDEDRCGIEIRVTSTRSYPVPADLAERVAGVVRAALREAAPTPGAVPVP